MCLDRVLILEWTNKQLMGMWKEKRKDLTNGGELVDRKEDESNTKDSMAGKLCEAESKDR